MHANAHAVTLDAAPVSPAEVMQRLKGMLDGQVDAFFEVLARQDMPQADKEAAINAHRRRAEALAAAIRAMGGEP